MTKQFYRIVQVCVVLATAFFLNACNSTMQTYKQGLKKYENGEYDLAIKDLKKALEGNYEPAATNHLIAESYRLSNRFAEALPFYQKALDAGFAEPSARFDYAYALKTAGEYTAASEQFALYAKADNARESLRERALREIETIRIIDRLAQNNEDIKIHNLSVNTAGTEYTSGILGDELVFSASKKEKIYKNNGQPMLGLYKMKISSDPAQSGNNSTLFSNNIQAPEANEGSPAFSPDGTTMVFARGNTGKKKGTADVDLYISRFANGQWSEARPLPVNDSLAWDGSPAFSRDGKTLYFASNRPGGQGGLDIYRTNMDASGRFSKPVNMGKDINTAGDEMFPYVAADGKLYFASDGHPGLGKLDLFVAIRSQGVITVQNMGLPFNSPQDDFGLIFYEDDTNGFFTSNRTGGKGDDDIYFFTYPVEEDTPDSTTIAKVPNNPNFIDGKLKTVRYYLEGDVISNAATGYPIDSATVKIMSDTSEIALAQFVTGKPGTFGKFRLEEGQDYILFTERPGYLSKRTPFTMAGKNIPLIFLDKAETDTTYRVTIRLDSLELNKTFVLENIYYDLDKHDIRPDAAIELNKLVEILQDNPSLTIELSSHTDARATDSYNMALSQRRAESAVNYLISRGIDADRMIAKGYGERQLIVPNARTEEEHQRNRRTEFTILSY